MSATGEPHLRGDKKTNKIIMKTRMKSIGIAVWLGTSAALVLTSGCAGDRYHQSTGEHIDDKATSMRVKSALGDDAQYKYPMVEVKTFKGTVQLSGFVNTRDQKNRAGDVAKRVEGVHNVENNITVKE
jgi:osmotically-inducible protein OsmY